MTHIDALGHVFFEGRAYNGRTGEEVLGSNRLNYGAVQAYHKGIVTRGVLLDIPRARGVEWIEPGDAIEPLDLEAAEALGGVRVEMGDALILRCGLGAWELANGDEDPAIRAGLSAACLPWLYSRDVALYGGDCFEHLPQPYERVSHPLHMIGLVAMGLVLLDNLAVEELASVALTHSRYEFCLVVAPLRIPGGTGSPVNPIALF